KKKKEKGKEGKGKKKKKLFKWIKTAVPRNIFRTKATQLPLLNPSAPKQVLLSCADKFHQKILQTKFLLSPQRFSKILTCLRELSVSIISPLSHIPFDLLSPPINRVYDLRWGNGGTHSAIWAAFADVSFTSIGNRGDSASMTKHCFWLIDG